MEFAAFLLLAASMHFSLSYEIKRYDNIDYDLSGFEIDHKLIEASRNSAKYLLGCNREA
jgi:hypothetical protein